MLFTKKFLGISIILVAGIFSVLIVAHAQIVTTSTPSGASGSGSAIQGITFPIPELGNCVSKDACKAFCNDTVNMDACIAFAKVHGLMNDSDASSAEKFKTTLETSGGPGGCKTPADCKAFCSDTANLAVCVQFAKDHGVKDSNVDQGEKILAYMKAGGTMPGGCTSRDTCKTYCSDFAHAEECAAFAKAVGITQGNGNASSSGSGTGAGDDQKFLTLVRGGQTPGGCASKDACETYCKDTTHRAECITFAVNAGFITQTQADLMDQSGGKGPGDCNSSDSCKTYCNDDTHRDVCLQFAQEHGLLNKDQVAQVQQGLTSLRAGLEQAPPAVVDCLQTTVGSSTLSDIQSGALVPSLDVAGAIRSCFQKFGSQGNPRQLFTNAAPQVKSCLKDQLGGQYSQTQTGTSTPTPEMADTLRICYQKIKLENGSSTSGRGGEGGNGTSTQGIQNFLRTAPAAIQPCLRTVLGDDFNKIASGTPGVSIDTSKLKGCFDQFRPPKATDTAPFAHPVTNLEFHDNRISSSTQGASSTGRGPKPPVPSSVNAIPPQYVVCINLVLGDGGTDKLLKGQATAEQKAQISQCVVANTSTIRQNGELPKPPQLQNASHTFDGQKPPSFVGGGGGGAPPPPAGNDQLPPGDQPPPDGGPAPDFSNPESNAQSGLFLANILGTFTGFMKMLFH